MSDSGSEAPAPIDTPAESLGLEEKSEAAADAGISAVAVAAAFADAEAEARADLLLFFGPNAQKFMTTIDRRKAGNLFTGVCWPAFFFPPAWFLYRKLYGWAAICCLVPILATAFNVGEFRRALLLAPIVLGVSGPRLYGFAAGTTIGRIRASSQSEAEARETIRRAGGVSIPGAVVGGLLMSISFAFAFVVALRAGLASVHQQLH